MAQLVALVHQLQTLGPAMSDLTYMISTRGFPGLVPGLSLHVNLSTTTTTPTTTMVYIATGNSTTAKLY